MNKAIVVFLLLLFLSPLALPSVHLVFAQPPGYVALYIVPNENENITVWLNNACIDLVPTDYSVFMTVNQSAIIYVTYGRSVILTSPYPFEINNSILSEYATEDHVYFYRFNANSDMTLYIDFLQNPPPNMTATTSFIPTPPWAATTTTTNTTTTSTVQQDGTIIAIPLIVLLISIIIGLVIVGIKSK